MKQRGRDVRRDYAKKYRESPSGKIVIERYQLKLRASGSHKSMCLKWVANNKSRHLETSSLYQFYGVPVSRVTLQQKIDFALILIGRRIAKGRIDKSLVNQVIYRIQHGDTYAAYE
jgi:hypothetical protein